MEGMEEPKDYKPAGNGRRINDLNSYISNVSKASDSVIISHKKLIASQAGTISAFKISATKMNKMIDDVSVASKNMMVGTAQFTRDSLRDFKRSLQEEFNVNKPNMLGMTVARAFGPLVGFMATKFAESGIYENLKEKISESWSDWREKRARNKREKVERYVDSGMEGGVHMPKMAKGGITVRDTKAQLHKGEAVVPLDKYFKYKGQSVFKRIIENQQRSEEFMNATFKFKGGGSVFQKMTSDLDQIRIGTIQQTGKMKMFFGNLFEKNPLFRKLYKTYMTLTTVLSAPRKLIGLLFKPRGGYIKDLPRRGSAADQTVAILGMIYTTGMTKLDAVIHYLKAIATQIVGPKLEQFKDTSGEDTMYKRIVAAKGKGIIEKIKIITGQSATKGFMMEMKELAQYAKEMGLKNQFSEAGTEAKNRVKKFFSKEGMKDLGGKIKTSAVNSKDTLLGQTKELVKLGKEKNKKDKKDKENENKEGKASEGKTILGRIAGGIRKIGDFQAESTKETKFMVKKYGQKAGQYVADRKKDEKEKNRNKKTLTKSLKEQEKANKEAKEGKNLFQRMADNLDKIAKSKKGLFGKIIMGAFMLLKTFISYTLSKFMAPFKLISLAVSGIMPTIKALLGMKVSPMEITDAAKSTVESIDGLSNGKKKKKSSAEKRNEAMAKSTNAQVAQVGKEAKKKADKTKKAQAKAKKGKSFGGKMAAVGGAVSGGLMVAEDSYGGYQKKTEWGVSGGAAALGGALGGTSDAFTAEGALGGVAKGAAVGAMFGPIGMGIGALVGGLLGFVGGKKLAEGADWVWKSVKKLGEFIWKVVKWPVEFLWKIIKKIWEPLEKMGKELWKEITGVWDEITKSFDEFVKGFTDGWNEVSPVMEELWTGFKDFMAKVVEFLQPVIDVFTFILGAYWKVYSAIFKGLWETLKKVLKEVIGAVKNAVSIVWDTIKFLVDIIWKIVQAPILAIMQVLTLAWDIIKALVTGKGSKGVGEAILKFINGMIDIVKYIFGGIWESMKKYAEKVLPKMMNLIWRTVTFIPRMLVGMISGIAKWLLESLTDYLPGGSLLRKTSLYEGAMKFLDSMAKFSGTSEIIPPAATTSDIAKKTTAAEMVKTTAVAGQNRKDLADQANTINNGSNKVAIAVTNVDNTIRTNQDTQQSVANNGGGIPGQHDPHVGGLVSGAGAY